MFQTLNVFSEIDDEMDRVNFPMVKTTYFLLHQLHNISVSNTRNSDGDVAR